MHKAKDTLKYTDGTDSGIKFNELPKPKDMDLEPYRFNKPVHKAKPKTQKKIERKKAFDNWRYNSIHLNFPNGNQVSTIWGRGSYSENHFAGIANVKGATEYYMDYYSQFMQSNNCEVMVECSPKLLKELVKRFNAPNPFGYLNITDWLYVVNAVAKDDVNNLTRQPKPKGSI